MTSALTVTTFALTSILTMAGCFAGSALTCSCGASGSLPGLSTATTGIESNRNAALETAKELVAQSLNDNGCIAYDVFESATRKDVLMICETWKDAESLDAHEKAAHFVTLVPKLQELGNMKLEKFEF